jgi:hypothetical protein
LSIQLDALPINGRIVLTRHELDEDDFFARF